MTSTSDPGRNLSPVSEVEAVSKLLGLNAEPVVVEPDGVPWMSHEEFDRRDAEACSKVNPPRIPYAEVHKTQIVKNGGPPWREFPCPGALLIPEDELQLLSLPILMARCSACNFEISFSRSQYDPNHGILEKVRRSGLPERFLGKRMDPVEEQKTARGVAREYIQVWDRPYVGDEGNVRGTADNPGPPLRLPAIALYGLPGRGKTHLLCSIAETLIRKCQADVQYWPFAALLNKVRDGYNDAAPTEMRHAAVMAWERAMNVELLVLDDIGAERPTEWAREQFQVLVDHRYAKEIPILLASNVPPDQWEDNFGARTTSRLKGMTFQFSIEGADLRTAG